MNAGRELDELVARHVFGGPEVNPNWWWWKNSNPPLDLGDATLWAGPAFSTDIAAAWTVVERMQGQRFSVRYRFWQALNEAVQYGLPSESQVAWPDALGWLKPHHICLAALTAVGVEVPA